MFNPNPVIKELATLRRNQLGEDQLNLADATLLCQVELGLYLLEHLGLKDEKVTSLWAILAGLPLPRLQQVNEEGQHNYLITMARLFIPYSGRFAWNNVLLDYARLPEHYRTYDAITPDNYEELLVETSKKNPDKNQNWIAEYYAILTGDVPWNASTVKYAEANQAFRFYAHTQKGKHLVQHKGIKPKDITLQQNPLTINLKTENAAIYITYSDLERTAEELDKCLIASGQKPQWLDRLDKYVNYKAFDKNDKLSDIGATLKLDGMSHVVGMVGAGKSTLMKLVAAYVAIYQPDKHITLVVGDTLTVLDIVNELNTLIVGNNPNTMQPVAVPLIGRTTRERHLTRFFNSVENPEKNWALRWLKTECLLFDIETITHSGLNDIPIVGREPCNNLDVSGENAKTARHHKCPLFHRCPSQQQFHDLSNACITITTPGAMAKSRIPSQIDSRGMTYGEFMYLHADIVIMDEVDTIIEWFDNVYAEVLDLWGKDHAVFNRADAGTSEVIRERRTTSGEKRWIFASRRSVEAIMRVMQKLTETPHNFALEHWLGKRYFTAFNLFTRLANRLAGQWDWDIEFSPETEAMINEIKDCFERLTENDPTVIPRPTGNNVNPDEDPTYRLSRILRGGLSCSDLEDFVTECEEWIYQFLPDIEASIIRLNQRIDAKNAQIKRKNWHYPKEDIRSLARKLALVLMITLLDHNLRIIFYEDYNRPETIDTGVQFYSSRSRDSFGGLLPIPPTGRIFGTYYANMNSDPNENQVLSRFEYRNIGRWYVGHFDSLLKDIGIAGPHVLALSGTSWLPDSTRWHFDVPPQGVMVALDEKRDAIRDLSEFRFLPQADKDNLPINVSGSDDILDAIQKLAKALVRTSVWTLKNELDELSRLGTENPALWHDRERLLLLTNSYAQSELVGQTLQEEWKRIGEDSTEVLYLKRGDTAINDEDDTENPSISRGEIEKFAQKTEGKILVAPMSAIGRGYNILNREIGQDKKAAFGAIYFLIRPMPHPYDIQALAGELNARTLQWYENETIWRDYATSEAQALAFRHYAKHYWSRAEMRVGYGNMGATSADTLNNAETEFERLMLADLGKARLDLAASTLGKFVQASGRLVRGGVPFHAFFVDAKWAPKSASFFLNRNSPNEQPEKIEDYDTVETSLLAQMKQLHAKYVTEFVLGETLYEPFEALLDIKDFFAHTPEEQA